MNDTKTLSQLPAPLPPSKRTTSNVFEATHQLRRILRIVGVATFTSTLQSTAAAPPTPFEMLCVLASVLLCCGSLVVVNYSTDWSEATPIITKGIQIADFCHFVNLLSTVVLGFLFNRGRMSLVLSRLHACDVALRVHCAAHVAHWQHRRTIAVLIVAVLAFVATIPAFTYFQQPKFHLYEFLSSALCQMFLSVLHASVIAAYAFPLWAVQQRMDTLNAAINQLAERRAIVPPPPPESGELFHTSSASRPDRIERVRCLRRLHTSLCDTAKTCNECFAVPIMVLTAIVFAYFLFFTINLYRMSSSPQAQHFAGLLCSFVAWNTFHNALVVALMWIGSAMTAAGRRSGVAVHGTLNELCWERDGAMMAELMQFSDQIVHRVPVATCGLFTFDWSLMYSVLPILCILV